MSRFLQVQEVLWISTPVFVVTSVLKYAPVSCCLLDPLTNKGLHDGLWKFFEIDFLRSKYSQHKRSFFIFLAINFCVWNNDVMDRFLFINWLQPSSYFCFPLIKPLNFFCCFNNNIVFVDFRESLSLRINTDNKKVD